MGISKFVIFVIILLNLFLLYSFNVLAVSNETIIKGWVNAGNRTVEGKVYNFVLNYEPKYVVMQFDNTLLRVSAESCDTKDYIQLCVEDVRLDRTDPATNINYYKAFVTVIKLNAYITADRSVSTAHGIVGDSFEITTSFENSGKRKAENVSFVEKIPDTFTIDIAEFNQRKPDCSIDLDANSIFWTGGIDFGQKVNCKYSIISNEAGLYNLEANLSYDNGLSTKSVFLPKITLNIKNGTLELQSSVSRTQLEISDIFVLNASLTNILANESPRVLFKADVPKDIRILNKTFEFDKDGNTIIWEDKLEKGNKINLSLVLMAINEGNFTIPITASYSSSGKDIVFIKKENISSYAKPLEVVYKQSDYMLNSSQNFSIFLALKSNTNKYYYKNIAASLASDMPTFKGITFTYDKPLENYSDLIVFNSSIAAPRLTKNTTFNITLNIEYETEFGQEKDIMRNYRIFVTEAYEPSEVKFFNLPLTSLRNKPINQTIPGLRLDEEKLSSQIYEILPKTPRGIIITVGVIILLVVIIFIYQRKLHLF